MTTRAELVLRFTLDAICDDYENLSVTIADDVTKKGADCGVRIERFEIVAALAELIERGWAKAYRMDGSGSDGSPPEIEGMPSLEEMEDFYGAWFYITDAGMKVQLADWDFWPFDDDNQIRKDWVPPLS